MRSGIPFLAEGFSSASRTSGRSISGQSISGHFCHGIYDPPPAGQMLYCPSFWSISVFACWWRFKYENLSFRILTYGIGASSARTCTKLALYSLTKSSDNITFGRPEKGRRSRGKNDHLWTDHLWTTWRSVIPKAPSGWSIVSRTAEG